MEHARGVEPRAILRKSSNGRRAVSKTVNVGSIPAFRAVTYIASNSTLAYAGAGLLRGNTCA